MSEVVKDAKEVNALAGEEEIKKLQKEIGDIIYRTLKARCRTR